MSLIDPDQKTAVEKSLRELRAAEAVSQFTATNKAVVTLVGNQHSVASVRGSCGTRHWRMSRSTRSKLRRQEPGTVAVSTEFQALILHSGKLPLRPK